jgi:carboxylesterase type B
VWCAWCCWQRCGPCPAHLNCRQSSLFSVSGTGPRHVELKGKWDHWNAELNGQGVAQTVSAFLGVRYASADRFVAPRMYEYDVDVANATQFGSACWQRYAEALQSPAFNEDCLFLNVWTPNTQLNVKKWPVVVYIHGGAFAVGAGSSRHVNGAMWAASHHVVFVSINYRLGVLGFYRSEALTAEQPETPANHGLLDQRTALLWIQRHIASFGGDPERVTVMGESAGAVSILAHLTSPSVSTDQHPLFQRAILQNPVVIESEDLISLEASYDAGDLWAREAGCDPAQFRSNPAQLLVCLRQLPASALIRPVFRWSALQSEWMASQLTFPVNDHVQFVAPGVAIAQGQFDTSCELFIGSAANESTLFTYLAYPLVGPTESLFRRFVEASFESHHDEIFARYHPSIYGGDAWRAMSDVVNDVRFQCPLHHLSLHFAKFSTAPLRRYLFNYVSTHSRRFLGSAHAQETSYVMQNPAGVSAFPHAFEPREWEFSRQISQLWAAFAWGKSEIVEWRQERAAYIQLGNTTHPGAHYIYAPYKEDVCTWWDGMSGAWNGTRLVRRDLRLDEPIWSLIPNDLFWFFVRHRALLINFLSVALVQIVVVYVIRLYWVGKNPLNVASYMPSFKPKAD